MKSILILLVVYLTFVSEAYAACDQDEVVPHGYPPAIAEKLAQEDKNL